MENRLYFQGKICYSRRKPPFNRLRLFAKIDRSNRLVVADDFRSSARCKADKACRQRDESLAIELGEREVDERLVERRDEWKNASRVASERAKLQIAFFVCECKTQSAS